MIFNSLSDKISSSLSKLYGKSNITNKALDETLFKIKEALLEADVWHVVVDDLIDKTKTKLLGKSIKSKSNPASIIVKTIYDELVIILGGNKELLDKQKALLKTDKKSCKKIDKKEEKIESGVISFDKLPKVVLLMGLQGSGKTTTAAKIALKFSKFFTKKVLLVSLDYTRPAARDQLKILADSIGVDIYEEGKDIKSSVQGALKIAKSDKYDLVILDSAGRTNLDDDMLKELKYVYEVAKPDYNFLVMDAAVGQQAANIASAFEKASSKIDGLVFTRVDGGSKCGSIISVCKMTGKRVVFLGVGESTSQLEEFLPERIASQILGSGDLISLVEKAKASVNSDVVDAMEKKLKQGAFNMNDFAQQLQIIKKMGGMRSLMSLLPSAHALPQGLSLAQLNDEEIKKNLSMISSMNKRERLNPAVLLFGKESSSRKLRIANGSGNQLSDINGLLQHYNKVGTMVKKMSKVDMSKMKDISSMFDMIKKIK